MTTTGFSKLLTVTPLPDGKSWVLREPLSFRNRYGRLVRVPAGFVMDFASIPRGPIGAFTLLLSTLFLYAFDVPSWAWASLVLLWILLPPRHGKHGNAATVHDWRYWRQDVTRAEADEEFLDGMEVLGVRPTRRWSMYLMVRWFGWYAWWCNQSDKDGGVIRVLTNGEREVQGRGLSHRLKRIWGRK